MRRTRDDFSAFTAARSRRKLQAFADFYGRFDAVRLYDYRHVRPRFGRQSRADGAEYAGTTLVAFCANYLYGFLLVVLPLVFTVILSNRLVARYVDRGSMAYLLATPCTRRKLIATQIFVLCGELAILFLYVTALCLGVSAMLFPGEMDVKSFILLNIGCYCLAVFLAGVCFLPSCVCNDSKTAIGIGAGICIAFVLLQMLSQVGDKFELLKYATPLTLFNTDAILANEAAAFLHCGILLGGGLLLMLCGQLLFMRRDLPV
ncbi:MAG: ABC transporter permease subunit [Ruthenibacterium sp.]